MKKRMKTTTSLMIVFILLSFAGCRTAPQKTSPPLPPAQEQPEGEENKEFVPQLNGVGLGDPIERATDAFGAEYTETYFDENLSLGEPFRRLAYENGVTVIAGENSNKVLEIETTSPDTANNLGFIVGDRAQDALEAYRAKYAEPKSNQSEDILTGWFLMEDQDLVIFNYDQTETLVNPAAPKPGSVITRIKLTNFAYMD